MTGWLDTLPSGWSVAKPRHHFRERREASRPGDVHLTPSQHHGVLSQTDYMARTGTKVVLNLSAPDNMKRVWPGDFIAHLRSFQGGLEKSDLAGKVSTAYTVIEPLPTVEPRFFKWVLKSPAYIQVLASSLEQLRDGQSIKFGDFAAISLPMPSLGEQRRIADFLGDRVARIDQIITARRLQLDLALVEFRSTLEREVWTSDGRMPLKHLLTSVTSGPRGWGDLVRDEGTPFVRIGNLRPLGIELNPKNLVRVDMPRDAEALRASINEGDVLLSITAAFGEVAVWRRGAGTFSQHVARLRPRSVGDAEWIAWTLQTHSTHDQYRLLAYGGTKIGMGLDHVRNLQIPDAGAHTRVEVAKRMARRWADLDSGARSLERSAALLTEYKQSLITAAVTGELDVTTAGSGIQG